MTILNDSIYVAGLLEKEGPNELRLMSYDMQGHLLYQQDLVIPHTSSLLLEGMLEDEGRLLVYGRVNNNGVRRVFVSVLDLQFNLLEDHLFGDPAISKKSTQLNKTKDGGYVLAYAEGVFTDVSLVVAKLDSNLGVEYSKPVLESGETLGFVNVFETADGGFMVAWQNDLSESLSDTFPYPTAVYKLDSLANVEWEYVFANRVDKSHISAVKVEGDKMFGVGITDYFYFEVDPDRIIDGWCFLINASGELHWERSISDVRESYGCRFWHGVKAENGFVLVGDIDRKNPSGVPFLNDPDVWFLTLDENGCWNGNCEEHIIITGDSTSITDTESPALPSEELTLYPNPTSGIFNIEYTDALTSSNRRIVVTNAVGEKMLAYELRAPRSTINLNQLAPGWYVVSYWIEGQLAGSETIIVQP